MHTHSHAAADSLCALYHRPITFPLFPPSRHFLLFILVTSDVTGGNVRIVAPVTCIHRDVVSIAALFSGDVPTETSLQIFDLHLTAGLN